MMMMREKRKMKIKKEEWVGESSDGEHDKEGV